MALAAVLWLHVAVAAVLGVHFTLSRRSFGEGGSGSKIFNRRQLQLCQMIVVYVRLASGEKMACQMLVVFCSVKYVW